MSIPRAMVGSQQAMNLYVARVMAEALNPVPRRPRSRLERLRDRIAVLRERVHGAWRVLTGRAEACDGDCY